MRCTLLMHSKKMLHYIKYTCYMAYATPRVIIVLESIGYTYYFDIFFNIKNSRHKSKSLWKYVVK
jgi:hypothetical protein